MPIRFFATSHKQVHEEYRKGDFFCPNGDRTNDFDCSVNFSDLREKVSVPTNELMVVWGKTTCFAEISVG